jgi:hypothetical protein
MADYIRPNQFNLSTGLSEHERPGVPPPPPTSSLNNRHEVIADRCDLRVCPLLRYQ